ncbi:MAG: hypothetical protein FJX53_04465 [Alphaproteobacteria bacterium]|nr:hypothetical protein [Alphaproteobacteria bacterium]
MKRVLLVALVAPLALPGCWLANTHFWDLFMDAPIHHAAGTPEEVLDPNNPRHQTVIDNENYWRLWNALFPGRRTTFQGENGRNPFNPGLSLPDGARGELLNGPVPTGFNTDAAGDQQAAPQAPEM